MAVNPRRVTAARARRAGCRNSARSRNASSSCWLAASAILDLRLACQIVGVAGGDREHVVAVDCDHDEIQDRPLAHDVCRRDGLARDALRGRLDPIGRQTREELGAEGDDRTIADLQLRRLIGRNPFIGSGRGGLSRGRRLRARQAGDAKEEYRDGRSQVA